MKISTIPLSRHWAEIARPTFYAAQPIAQPMQPMHLSLADRAYLMAVLAGRSPYRMTY